MVEVDEPESRRRFLRRVAQRRRLVARHLEHTVCVGEVARCGHRLARLDQEHRAARGSFRQRKRGAIQEVRRRWHVAAGKCPSTCRGQSRGGADPELSPVFVERSELAQESMRLLQVIAEDLLELQATLPLGVHNVGPFDEAFMDVRTGPLELTVVSGIPDQDVMEPEVGLALDARIGRVNELFAVESRQVSR